MTWFRGHIGMRDLERQIEKGISQLVEDKLLAFGVPAVCDAEFPNCKTYSGMRYSLPSRDLIADCIETVAEAHQLDGLVLFVKLR